MFDFHMHSWVSDDCSADPKEMVAAAERVGLREICFTDHMDAKVGVQEPSSVYRIEDYNRAYENLYSSKVKIRLGMEFGMTINNRSRLLEELAKREYDFVIGSVHSVRGECIFFDEYWERHTVEEIYTDYLTFTAECLKVHVDFHVLGHMTCPTKVDQNTAHEIYSMEKYGDYAEEIFRLLIDKGIGMEVNTSGLRVCEEPLPPLPFVKRYLEMGGEILTIGSDAHRPQGVGRRISETLAQLKEMTPWICTFEKGKPVFHRISELC